MHVKFTYFHEFSRNVLNFVTQRKLISPRNMFRMTGSNSRFKSRGEIGLELTENRLLETELIDQRKNAFSGLHSTA